MNTPFKGFETKEITLFAGEGIKEGEVITLGNGCKAEKSNDGDKFCGLCTVIRGDYASVVMKGYAKVNYSGAAPAVGYVNLAADGNGKVKSDENGREYLVLYVDEASSAAEILIN